MCRPLIYLLTYLVFLRNSDLFGVPLGLVCSSGDFHELQDSQACYRFTPEESEGPIAICARGITCGTTTMSTLRFNC